MKIDLVLLAGQSVKDWPLGKTTVVEDTVEAVRQLIQKGVPATNADAWLFWDATLGQPDPEIIKRVFQSPGDLWHAGLLHGTGGKPAIIDFVHPIWMLNCDPEPNIAAVSWRLSLRACLVKADVLRQMGGPRGGFRTLLGAGLEWGHRLTKLGVQLRHTPDLLPDREVRGRCFEALPVADELLFARLRFSPFWYRWGIFRALASGALPWLEILAELPRVASAALPAAEASYRHEQKTVPEGATEGARVSVLLPTIDRYPYLRTLLQQLRAQTVKPHEVIIVDQTGKEDRDLSLAGDFKDLPLIYFEQDFAGQCSSRNRGLAKSTGDFILFLDDDVEIPADYIERHLKTLSDFRADSTSGVVYEPGDPVPSAPFPGIRVSDVFPAGNTLIRRSFLGKSGLFDLAYDQGQRADGDLGMRVMLSGAHMVLNPQISILHHRAPRGGLRTHGQRVVTRASSRSKLTHMNLASRSDIYLAKRYFSKRQVREMLWISVLTIFSARGTLLKRLLKVAFGVALFPSALRRIRANCRDAEALLKTYPQISMLNEETHQG